MIIKNYINRILFFAVLLENIKICFALIEQNSNIVNLYNVVSNSKLEPFQQIVTIGDRCLTKMRVLHFLRTFDKKSTIENPNHLFDYMIVGNYSRLGEALTFDFNDSFNFESLKIRTGSYPMVYNFKYNFIFSHTHEHFSATVKETLDKETPKSYYNLIKDKFDHLTQNSQKAFINNQKPTVYVAYTPDITSERQLEFVNFLKVMKSKRNLNFLLVVLGQMNENEVTYEFDKLIEGNLIFHNITFYPIGHWNSENSTNEWNQILKILLFPE